MKFFGHRQAVYAKGYLPCERTVKQLTRSGSRDGMRGIDKQASPTSAEREMAAQYQAAAVREATETKELIAQEIDNTWRREPAPTPAEVCTLKEECAALINGIATAIRARTGDQWNDVVEAWAYLKQFKTNAGINHPAVYPESKISHYANLFLLGLTEAAFNAWFYGSTSPDGLGAGLLQAAIISAAIIGAGAMAGIFLLRSCFSPNRIRQAFGLVGMVAYLGFASYLSLAAANFRDALAEDIAVNGVIPPMAELLKSPMDLSFEAITLLAFAIMASALAVYKGFTSDSVVPGHGHLDRSYRRALKNYQATWSMATQKILSGQESVKCQLNDLVEKTGKDLERRTRSLAAAKSAATAYESVKTLLGLGHAYAINVYRDAADVVQPTRTPWPKAIELVYPELPQGAPEAVEKELKEDRERLDELRTLAAEVKHTLNKVAAEAQTKLEIYRAALEAAHTAGTPVDSPKLKLVAELAN